MSRKWLDTLGLGIVFLVIFLGSVASWWDFDIWFHIKSGEQMVQQGHILHTDLFAYTTAGREWYPHEWLFQVVVYEVQHIFGLEAVRYFIALCTVATVAVFYKILRDFVKVKRWPALAVSILFWVSTLEFYTQRPQIWSQLFLLASLYCLLAYVVRGWKWPLVIFVLTAILWTNSHGSVFLAPLLPIGFMLLAVWQRDWVKVRTLGIMSVITGLATILPPLGTLQYRMLVFIAQHGDIISKFVQEWAPLRADQAAFIIYSVTVLLVVGLFLVVVWRTKSWKDIGWILLLSPLLLSAYLAGRNIFFGYVVMGLMLGFVVSRVDWKKRKWVAVFLTIVVIGHGYVWLDKRNGMMDITRYYPVGATTFIKDQKIQGNMFNEYGYGAYMLYHLYPEVKVFIDGRTDLYLCCEMPEVLDLAVTRNREDVDYKPILDAFWQKHDISYVVLRTQKHSLVRKIARILQNDVMWRVVYWDDTAEIFVRMDGKNTELVEKFGAQAATPYNQELYRSGQEEQAFEEYSRMLSVADSAKSRNAVGYLLLKQGKFDEAKVEFQKATRLDPLNESAYMNLAELSVHGGDIQSAIELYRKAVSLAPDRGLAYIRLGQLLDESGKQSEAREVWQRGTQYTVDEDARKTLQKLITGQ